MAIERTEQDTWNKLIEGDWGYWKLINTFIKLPKIPLQKAGHHTPPFKVRRPDGLTVEVVEYREDGPIPSRELSEAETKALQEL